MGNGKKSREKFVVAVKDVSQGSIRPGKILGTFRALEFARRALPRLGDREFGMTSRAAWCVGVFQNGNFVTDDRLWD